MDFSKINKIYMIGIKGVGMTMLAEFLTHQGKIVFGSDVAEEFMTDQVLKKAGIRVYEGFDAARIDGEYDLIIYSTAYTPETNEELRAALDGKVKTIKEIEGRAGVFNPHYGIAVCGSHGKTTTSAWLAYVLKAAGFDPNAMIGARVPQLGGESLLGSSNYFVLEADEYQNKLRYLEPHMVLLNNIDYDHPDYFKTVAEYEQAFADFVARVPKSGVVIANFDDPVVKRIVETNCSARIVSYSLAGSADYSARDISVHDGQQFFSVVLGNLDTATLEENETSDLGTFPIALSGQHNISNALGVIAACLEIGMELLPLRTHLAEFTGTARRMERMGSFRGVDIVDDYAHHPTEIRGTFEAIKQRYPGKKIRAVFHPHTFTRTKALLAEFGKSFAAADEVIVLEIYGSAREEQGGTSGLEVAEEIRKNGGKNVKFIATLADVECYLRESIGENEVILLLGAGDVFRIGERLIS